MEMISRISLIFVFVLFFSGSPFSERKCVVRIDRGSELYLKGSANVKDFTCRYDQQLLETSVPIVFRKKEGRMIFDKALIRLENRGFGCGGRGINKDFHSLLQTESHPYIDLRLREVIQEPGELKAKISITIAGEQGDYEIPVKLQTEGVLKCSGVLPLDIRDFGLEPPKKMLGLIVVDEKIAIYFDLSLRIGS